MVRLTLTDDQALEAMVLTTSFLQEFGADPAVRTEPMGERWKALEGFGAALRRAVADSPTAMDKINREVGPSGTRAARLKAC